MKKQLFAAVLIAMLTFSTAGYAITLPNPLTSAFQYGDFYSYSLPILAYQYDQAFGGGVGPGNPYYIPSSPGQISDLIVVATGVNGGPATTNFAGMNDAYSTPSGPDNKPSVNFSTENTANPDNNPIPGYNDTWNSTIAAFLTNAGTAPVFFFNNNQKNSGSAADQTLFAWGQLIIRDTSNDAPNLYFDFTNNGGAGPIPGPASDVIAYNSPGATTSLYPFAGPAGWPAQSDFVLSGGQVTVPIGPLGANVTFNHNLGANQAAYAITAPELNAFLNSWTTSSPYDALSIDLRFMALNNGYEQVFIAPGTYTPPPIPEPSTFLLLGAGLLGLGYCARRRKS